MPDILETELEQLIEELEQERKVRNALEKSTQEVEVNVCELERRLLGDEDEEGNEWRQRFNEQFSSNEVLQQRLSVLEEKTKELKKLDSANDSKRATKLNDAALRNMIRQFEKENRTLVGKIKDLEWRLDTESQEVAKMTEEQEKYKIDLNQANQLMDEVRIRATTPTMLSPLPGMKFNGRRSSLDLRERQYGLPDNRRILDASKGPVKKTAAVKKLPKLGASIDTAARNARLKSSVPKKKVHRKTKSSDDVQMKSSQVVNDERPNDTA